MIVILGILCSPCETVFRSHGNLFAGKLPVYACCFKIYSACGPGAIKRTYSYNLKKCCVSLLRIAYNSVYCLPLINSPR